MGTTESIFYDEEETHEKDEEEISTTTSTSPPHRKVQRQAPTTGLPPSTARRRSLRQPPERHTLFKLNVFLLGRPKSGKQTLLHRLRGKDPFSAVQEHLSAAVVPYQSPRPVEDRIQLQVEIHRLEDESQQQNTDLAILLIDPRHDRERIEQSICEAIQFLWHKTHNENKPFCLCILINFWDKVYKSEKKQRVNSQVSESDVQQMTLMALQEQSADLEPSRLHLQCATTSLFNCYGLGILHFFIYQSYLLHKQWQVQNTLQTIQQSLKQSRESGPQVISYEDYLKQLRKLPSAPSPEQPEEPISRDPLQDSTKMPVHRRAVVIPTEAHKKPTALLQNVEASRKALEAFLADEEDDDEVLHKQKNMYDSDDDSEVFYDESGQRQIAGQDSNRVRRTMERTTPSERAKYSGEKSERNGIDAPVKTRNVGRPNQKASTGDDDSDHISQSIPAKIEIGETDAESRNISQGCLSREESDNEGGCAAAATETLDAKPSVVSVPNESGDKEPVKMVGDKEPVKMEEELDSHTSSTAHGSALNGHVPSTKDVQKIDEEQVVTDSHTHPGTQADSYDKDGSKVPEEVSVGNNAIHKTEEEGGESEFFAEKEETKGGDAASKPLYESIPDASTSEIRQRASNDSPSTESPQPATDGTIRSQGSSSKMSPAVLAAIAAAQQEAETMLQQQLLQEKEKRRHDKTPKKAKKKKEKKEKKNKEIKFEREVNQSS